ncbi:MAG: methylmalonyl-CoA mutase [Micromonosporaceae bacterium]|nr:methylmalonyl-CoA mutase [Micromonosporaceae bacterium]
MMAPRVLIAKPGLDGHDRGAQVVSRILRDAGYEVIYTGLRQSPEAIAHAAVSEDVDLVGLSLLSASHLVHCPAVRRRLDELGASDIPIVAGGVIPDEDVPALRSMGVSAVVGVGATPAQVLATVRAVIDENQKAASP